MKSISPKINSLEPVLEVNDMEETIAYYKDKLGFSVDWTWPEQRKVDQASVSFGQGHQGDHHEDYHIHIQLTQADDTPVQNSGWLYIRIDSGIDDLYSSLKNRGANISYELGDRPWGMREFDVKDNNGHILRFAYAIPNE